MITRLPSGLQRFFSMVPRPLCAHFPIRLATLVGRLSWLASVDWVDCHICPSIHQQWVFQYHPCHTSQGTSWSIKAIDGSKKIMIMIPLFLFVMSYVSLILWEVSGYESQWLFCNVRYFSSYFWTHAKQHAPWRYHRFCTLWCTSCKKYWCGIGSYGLFFCQKRLFQYSRTKQRQSPGSSRLSEWDIETVD
jgi:hypothetical protein